MKSTIYLQIVIQLVIIHIIFPHQVQADTKIQPINATASRSNPSSPPTLAFDNNPSTSWESGAAATQWIMLDLGQTYTINQLSLTPRQSPSGRTSHYIEYGSDPSTLAHLLTLDSITSNNQTITIPLTHPVSTRYIKITTSTSPSWVSWSEISVYQGNEKANSNLSYFGYMSYEGLIPNSPTDFISKLNDLNNTNIVWSYANNAGEFANAGYQTLITDVRWVFFSGTTLNPSYSANWQLFKQRLEPYKDTIYGFYFDEPHLNGYTTEAFHIATKTLREAYPDKAVMAIEGYPSVRDQNIPLDYYKYVTDIGFDYYFTLYHTTNDPGWAEYLELTSKFSPHTQNKRYWLVPDGLGPAGSQSRLADAYERYYGLAISNPQTVGILGFIYTLPQDLAQTNIGLSEILTPGNSQYNETFRNRQIELGSLIIKPTASPSPSPSAKPGDLNGDGSVNLQDFNRLITNFGNPYNIYDFNRIVSNYGR